MRTESSSGKKPTGCRYSPEEKAAAVRVVPALRADLGTEQGTVSRVTRPRLATGGVSTELGGSGRHRRRVRTWDLESGVGKGQAARAGEPRT